MSKRPSHSSPNHTPKAKRLRPVAPVGNQLQLDDFFCSSPQKSSTSSKVLSGQSGAPEPIDVDALEEHNPGPLACSTTLTRTPETIDSGHGHITSSPRKAAMAFGVKAAKPENLPFQPIDIDPVFYDPDSQPWTSSCAPYSFLTHTFTTLSQTRSRIIIINSLTNTLRTILSRHPPSLLPSLYLLSNSVSPPYVGTELGIGSSIISKAIQQVSGLSAGALKQLYTTTGDAGDVAFLAKSKVRTLIPHPPLTIEQVYDSLLKISACKGQGAAKQKEKIIEKLLVAGSGEEVRYLVRTLTMNLRVGAVRTSILTAFARAFVLHGPQTTGPSNRSDSPYATQELLRRIRLLAMDSKKKGPEHLAREELKNLFVKAEGIIKQVYVRHPCYDDIVPPLMNEGFIKLADRVPLAVGIPLLPTLGSPTRSLDEIYERLGDLSFSAEFKYDGQRAQIHARIGADGNVSTKIFSRHLEDMTTKYPDVILLVEHLLKASPSVNSFIIDSEIVAIDLQTGDLRSFQDLSSRARKDVQIADIRIPVSVYAFDLLYCNDKSYLAKPFRERRQILRQKFPPHLPENTSSRMAGFCHVESCESDQGQSAIMQFWEKSVESRCEGLMIKVLDYEVLETKDSSIKSGKSKRKVLPATYEPDKRTSAWLKLKKDYIDTIGDSLDLIPLGAWYGNGRKAGWWSPILLGLWNPETGRPVGVCKCMSGFTDAFYKSLLERYPVNSDNCSAEPRWECDLGGFRPDVYFKPSEVWELRGADITESPVSVAAQGLVSDTRGLSVRFPRFIKVRGDKGIEQANTPQFLASMWRSQQKRPGVVGADDGDLIDVDIESTNDSDSENSEGDSDEHES